jgi:hypothetical protein
MQNKKIYQIGLAIGLGLLIIGLIMLMDGQHENARFFLLSGLPLMAISFTGLGSLRSFSFTMWIFSAVCFSMYFPQLFTGIGDFSFKTLIIPLLQMIMFGVGCTMGLSDFTGVIKMPKGVIVGVVLQFTHHAPDGLFHRKDFWFPFRDCCRYYPGGMCAQRFGFQCNVLHRQCECSLVGHAYRGGNTDGTSHDSFTNATSCWRICAGGFHFDDD